MKHLKKYDESVNNNKIMGSKTKFKIEYTIDKKELVDRVEKQLLTEGWEKTNYTYPSGCGEQKTDEIYTTWFDREWF